MLLLVLYLNMRILNRNLLKNVNNEKIGFFGKKLETKLNSLSKCQVFGPVVQTPEGVKPMEYKWVSVRKINENNEITRYKARLVAQGFSQRYVIDYEETYSPMVDAVILRFLISLAVSENFDMHFIDVVTTYLYGSLCNDIYMKVLQEFKVLKTYKSSSRKLCSIKFQRSLYGLKQSEKMWYNGLSEYLLKKGYQNNPICLCVFIKKSQSGFTIITIYVDLHIIETLEELSKEIKYLKKEFEMKDLGKTKFFLGFQIEHLVDEIFFPQSTHTKKVLKRFYMDKTHPLNIPMQVRSLDVKKDIFRPRDGNEELLGPEVPYFSAISTLMYLANNTRLNIAFSVNLLARYSFLPTKRHWSEIKHILCHLLEIIDMRLFYSNKSNFNLVGFAYFGFLFDPHKARSHTGYLFTYGETTIPW
ncbi:hypothetical protein IC582_019559 [Cucumis melo]